MIIGTVHGPRETCIWVEKLWLMHLKYYILSANCIWMIMYGIIMCLCKVLEFNIYSIPSFNCIWMIMYGIIVCLCKVLKSELFHLFSYLHLNDQVWHYYVPLWSPKVWYTLSLQLTASEWSRMALLCAFVKSKKLKKSTPSDNCIWMIMYGIIMCLCKVLKCDIFYCFSKLYLNYHVWHYYVPL